MISCELAIKLHRGGFKCAGKEDSFEKDGEIIQVPTLEELIEACGKNKEDAYSKFILWFCPSEYGNWHAGEMEYCSESYVDDYPQNTENGETPEEAVANLWLTINKKTS
mgnify:FL=1